MKDEVRVWIDGASRGNPGESGAGAIIREGEGKVLGKISNYLGDSLTNNQSEYFALRDALEFCIDKGIEKVKIFSDSELLVNQMKGEYEVNSENIMEIYEEAKSLESELSYIEYNHVPREENEDADELANRAIDRKGP